MIEVLLTSVYILLIICSYMTNLKLKNKAITPGFIYTAIWGFCGVTSIYNGVGLLKPRISIHCFVIISIIIANVIYIFFSKKTEKKEIKNDNILNVNYKIIYIISIIAIILIMPNLIQTIKIIITKGFDLKYIRDNVYLEMTSFFTKNIPNAIFNAVAIFTAIELCMGKKKTLWITIINIAIYTITYGGRLLMFNFMIYIFAAYIILGKRLKVKIKKRYIVSIVLLIVLITYFRNTNIKSLFNSFVKYFVGPLSFLEYILRNPGKYDLFETYKLGYMSFAFLIEPIILFVKLFFGASIKVPSYYFNIHAQNFVNISGITKIQKYNNNTTYFYHFLLDYGWFGFIMAPLTLFTFIIILEKLFSKKTNLKTLMFLVYIYMVLVNSSMVYSMGSVTSSLILIFIFIIGSSTKKKKEDLDVRQIT